MLPRTSFQNVQILERGPIEYDNETLPLGRGLAVEENGRLRKDLCTPGRPSWQTEGLPPAILTPSVASRLAEGGGIRRGEVVGPERRQTRPETRE
ncbi:hypothetical protein NDU88_000342 [Pleurodeles waltl]|uniref:Uncharacterized protein n=1 Tax=Pleurodeles waltl TaxID=8319 RepID=A0AAV7TFA0_PLEWA|nr:hypothetical protein NDU88_000342 [Pleurodeles waltl]